MAEEAAVTAEAMGNRVERLYDVGVAGLHRLLNHNELLLQANVVVAVAGMEGALASVISGMVEKPIVAVPTSVGYGASFEGLAALLAMLNSCAPGVAVVNIDNGFGAGYLAGVINRQTRKKAMRTSYFDCFSGITGNMILGALVDLGLDIDELRSKLAGLPLGDHSISVAKVLRQGIASTYVEVTARNDAPDRTLEEVTQTIQTSALDPWVKAGACRIFTRLAEAEARVHGHDGDTSWHLHEVGATDTIIDVVGGLVGLQMLDIEVISSSPINLGSGLVQCSHGWLPVPAPATAELVKGVPVYGSETRGELTTPTGAAMITGLAASFGPCRPWKWKGWATERAGWNSTCPTCCASSWAGLGKTSVRGIPRPSRSWCWRRTSTT